MTSPSRGRLSFEGLIIDLDGGEIVRNGEVVQVEPQVLDLIALLASSPGRLVPHEEILEKVWGHRFVSDSTIASASSHVLARMSGPAQVVPSSSSHSVMNVNTRISHNVWVWCRYEPCGLHGTGILAFR